MQYKTTKLGFLVSLARGEEIITSLTQLAETEKIASGFLFGLGAVSGPNLGYYDLSKKVYISKEFKGDYEIVNLTGNISWMEGKPTIHAHMTISDEEGKAFGGHLFSGRIHAAGEFAIFDFETEAFRSLDPETGLKLLELSS